jgi:DNA-binding beta-propeller fold protein YncE
MAQPNPTPSADRLDSWKEIAAYLKREVRTVRRWEKSEGLPVHRHVHNRMATVYAYKSEMDAWWASRQPQLERKPVPRWVTRGLPAGAGVLALAAVLVLWPALRWKSPPPAPVPFMPGRLLAQITSEGQQPQLIHIGSDATTLFMNPTGQELYVTEYSAAKLHVIEVAARRVVHSSQLPSKPARLTGSVDGKSLYIGTDDGEVLRFDTRRRTTERLAAGIPQIQDMVLTEDGEKLYVTSPYKGLHVVELASGRLQEIPTVRCPTHLTTVPGRDLLYVAYQCGGPGGRSGHDAIDVRTASTGIAKATIVGPPHVGGEVVVSPNGAQVWASGNDACINPQYDGIGCPSRPSSIVNIFRTDDQHLVASLALPATGEYVAQGIAFFPDGSRATLSGNALRVVDAASLRVVEQTPTGHYGKVAFAAQNGTAFLALPKQGDVAVLDLAPDKCLAPPQQLAVWWSGDGHANDVRDGNTGEFRNGAEPSPGWIGQAFRFDGQDDHVHVSKLSNIDLASDFSLALWLKPARGAGTILDHAPPGKAGWKLAREADGRLNFCFLAPDDHSCVDVNSVLSKGRAADNEWAHLAVTLAGRHVLLFLNGELDTQGEAKSREIGHYQDLRIGAPFRGSNAFAGKLDEIQMFRKALSAQEIRALYGAGRAGLCYR